MNEKVTLSSPWQMFYKEIRALFQEDPEVSVFFDEEETEIKLYVEDAEKASALVKILPAMREFGNVTVKVTVIPANGAVKFSHQNGSRYDIAFRGNNAYIGSKTYTGIFANPITYVVFKKKVVQIYSDNLGDIYGNTSTLYQDIAYDVLIGEGTFYCTDK